MKTVFGSDYSSLYNLVYKEKDYAAESSLVLELIEKHAGSAPRNILDLGCGTGGHVAEFRRQQVAVTGVDRSEDMLRLASQRLAAERSDAALFASTIEEFRIEQTFDAVVSMFAVMGYLTSNEAFLAGLKTARKHLQAGGIFLFDFWYGPAVMSSRPETREKLLVDGDERIIRKAVPYFNSREQCTEVSYHFSVYRGDTLVREVKEVHKMRYFFPLELDAFLSFAGFELLQLSAFPEIEQEASEENWNAIAVARAV